MKKYITMFMLLLFCCRVSSQNQNFEYKGRNSGAVTKDKLYQANVLKEITPQFEQYFFLPPAQRDLLKHLKKMDYAQDFLYPEENYSNVMEYMSVKITVSLEGQTLSAESKNEILTKEQSILLRRVAQGDNIQIRIKFKFKNPSAYKLHRGSEIMEGFYNLTVIPCTEAIYPGGMSMLNKYVMTNVFDHLSMFELKNMRPPVVKFTVNEFGKTSNIRMLDSTGLPNLDRIILEAFQKMPAWTPAKDKNGGNVEQDFTIPFGEGC